MDESGGRRAEKAVQGSIQRRAVTRSVTRNRNGGGDDQSVRPDKAGPKSARRRLIDKLNRNFSGLGENVCASKFSADLGSKNDAETDFCPVKFHGSSSSDAVQDVVCTFCPRKIAILEKVGLGGLQYLKRGIHNSRHLVFWLLKRMDIQRMQLKLGDGSRVEMNLDSVERILGVRCRGSNISVSSGKVSEYVKQRLRECFGLDETKEVPDLSDLRKVLHRKFINELSEYDEETFMISIAAYVCAYMFGPAMRTAMVPKDIWDFISNPDKLLNCNWGGYVLSTLQSCARTVQQNVLNNPSSIKLGGSWLYLELLYLDSIDLFENNIPLDRRPRIRWYDPQLLNDFTNHYEKCKGQKAKEAYLTRKRRGAGKEDIIDDPTCDTGGENSDVPANTTQRTGETPECREQTQDHIPSNRLANLVSSVKKGIDEVRSQVDRAERTAHAENKRRFAEHEQRIKELFGDVQTVIAGLSETLVQRITLYGSANVEGSSGSRGTKGVKPEHCTGPLNAKKGGSCRSEEAGDNKSQMWDEKIEDIPATVIHGGNGERTDGPKFDATPTEWKSSVDGMAGWDKGSLPGTSADAAGKGSETSAYVDTSKTKDALQGNTGGSQRAKRTGMQELDKDCILKKRKQSSSDSVSPTKSRLVTKKTSRKIRTVATAQPVHGDSIGTSRNAIIAVETIRITPIKRHVAKREVPPSPFDLNLVPASKGITIIEKKYRNFVEDYSDSLEKYWFDHDEPWPIKLSGQDLQNAFSEGGQVQTEVFDAIIRLLQVEDTIMYSEAGCEHQQWRHLLPPCFVDLVLPYGTQLGSDGIKELFIGRHLRSNVEHCRMVMVPSNLTGHWTLYAWDMELKRIHVLDPVLCKETRLRQASVHSHIVATFHERLFDCIIEFLSGMEDDRTTFKVAFYNQTHETATKHDSAFYVAHYMKWFDGGRITFAVDQRKVRNLRMTIWYNLVQMESNNGWKPEYVTSCQ